MSALDLARWGTALLSGNLVPSPVVRQAIQDSLGWGRANTLAGVAFVHQGQWIIAGNRGVRTAIALLPDSVVAVLFLNTNVPCSPTTLLVNAFNLAVPTFATLPDSRREHATVHITVPVSASEVRFTTDGSEPTPASPLYASPVTVQLPTHIRARGFTDRKAASFESAVRIPGNQ